MTQPVAPYNLVEVFSKDAAGKTTASAWVLDPRERSIRVAREDVAAAWALLPPAHKNVENLVNLLVDKYGFMRPAKQMALDLTQPQPEEENAPARKPDPAWNWKGVVA